MYFTNMVLQNIYRRFSKFVINVVVCMSSLYRLLFLHLYSSQIERSTMGNSIGGNKVSIGLGKLVGMEEVVGLVVLAYLRVLGLP